MSDSIAERMDAGWQAARHWETECEAARAERDGHLETIRETFGVLAARGQAPDDNAPLSVTVRRVLDVLDRVTAERDALKKRVADAESGIVEHYQDPHGDHIPCVACEYPAGVKVALVRLEDGET